MRNRSLTVPTLSACAAIALLSAGAGHVALVSASPETAARSVSAPDAGQAAKRFEGEFGLYVRVLPEGLEVRWLTDEREDGIARALVDGVVVDEKTTRRDTAHAARLEVASPVVTVEYGYASGQRYRTQVVREVPAEPAVALEAPDSVYVFGDVHGQFDRITTLLRGAGLIDDDLRWRGGAATVAFLGDVVDRGPDVTGVLWLLYRLEREAAQAGGRVLVVLGNHEAMIMSGDLRYVHGSEASIGFRHGLSYQDMFSPTESVLGRWLASKPGLMRLGDMLLAHGGMSPRYLDYTLREFEDTLRAFIAESLFVGWSDDEYLREFAQTTTLDSAGVARRYDFFFGRESVLWFRDLVLADTLGAFLDEVLDRFDARVHIVAHTPGETIHERYGGALIAVDLLDAGAEMLLMVREEDGDWARFKLPLEGEAQPLTASRVAGPG